MGVLYCNSDFENIPFSSELSDLESHLENYSGYYGELFFVKHIVSSPDTVEVNEVMQRGHITQNIIAEALAQICERGLRDHELFVFVCGPPSFNQVCENFLNKLSIHPEQIFVFEG